MSSLVPHNLTREPDTAELLAAADNDDPTNDLPIINALYIAVTPSPGGVQAMAFSSMAIYQVGFCFDTMPCNIFG